MSTEDILNSEINKEWDLGFLYDQAVAAKNSGEFKNSIKLTEKGIKEAKSVNDYSMETKFSSLHSEAKNTYLSNKIRRYLKRANLEENIYRYDKAIHFFEKAHKNLNKLFKLGKDIKKIRKKISEVQKDINRLREKKDLEEPNFEQTTDTEHILEVDIREEEIEEFDSFPASEEKLVLNEKKDDIKIIPPGSLKRKDSKIIEDLIDNDLNEVDMELDDLINNKNDSLEIREIESYHPPPQSRHETLREHLNREMIEISSEELSQEIVDKIKLYVKKCLESQKYYVVPEIVHKAKEVYEKIDVLGIKIIRVDEFRDLIIMLPIKISNFRGILSISENKTDYFTGKGKIRVDETKKNIIIGPNINNLKECQDLIFKDLINEGNLFDFFKKYLKMEISVEKTISKKKLFFRFKQLQYKILTEPILVTKEPVAFTEISSLSFPYRRKNNLHAIRFNQIPDLIKFLEKKYVLIEKFSQEENSIQFYFDSISIFMTRLRLAAILTLLVIGACLGIIFGINGSSGQAALNLIYASMAIFFIAFAFMYIQFLKKKMKITEDFNIPYYKKNVDLDEDYLTLISEKLPELMDQFMYECFGKDVRGRKARVLEESRVAKEIVDIEISEDDIFDKKNTKNKKSLKKNPENILTERISKRYSTFLED